MNSSSLSLEYAAAKALTADEKFSIITGHLQEHTKDEVLKKVLLHDDARSVMQSQLHCFVRF